MTKRAKKRVIKRLIVAGVIMTALTAGVVDGIQWSKNNPDQWQESVENRGF